MTPVNDPTMEERVAIVDLADELQVHKSWLFKIIDRLRIEKAQRRDPDRGNQLVTTVTARDATTLREEVAKSARSSDSRNEFPPDNTGFFYLVQLEPEFDPGRFKVGFTTDLDGRIQKHRCCAPFATYIKVWPCQRVWERAAIDCATDKCERLHTEVFRAESLEEIAGHCDAFFAMMPAIAAGEEFDEGDGDPPNRLA